MTNEVRKLLKRARARVARGWCKGESRKRIRGRVHHCAFGAIFYDSPKSPNYKACHIAREHMAVGVGIAPNELGAWNDDPKRTKRQVLAAFDKAIASVSAAASPAAQEGR